MIEIDIEAPTAQGDFLQHYAALKTAVCPSTSPPVPISAFSATIFRLIDAASRVFHGSEWAKRESTINGQFSFGCRAQACLPGHSVSQTDATHTLTTQSTYIYDPVDLA